MQKLHNNLHKWKPTPVNSQTTLIASAFAIFLCFAASVATAADPVAKQEKVYLLAKGNFEGTTYTIAVFLYDAEITDLAACEKERIFGRRGNWRHYRHRVVRGGLAFNANYFCVKSDLPISVWREHEPYDHMYLIDVRNNGFTLQKSENYNSCLATLRQTQAEESYEFFCARANQWLLEQRS